MRVLLLTPSVFYSLLSHYQVAPQLPGKWYIQNKSQVMAHCHKTCKSLHHCINDHNLVNSREYLVDTFPRFSPLVWSRISGFWVSGEAGVKSRSVWARANSRLRDQRPEPEPGAGARHFVSGQLGPETFRLYPLQSIGLMNFQIKSSSFFVKAVLKMLVYLDNVNVSLTVTGHENKIK